MLKRFKKIDKPLLIITIILIAIGLVMIFSASNVAAFRSSGDSYRYLKRQLMVLAVCAVATIVILKFKTSSYKALSWAAVIGIGLALAGLFVLGTVRNDTLGWYDLGPFLFQPSEFAKVILIVWMASYYDTKKKENLEQYMFVFFPVIVAVVFFFLIMFQPDLGTAGIIALIAIVMFYAVPMSKKNRNTYNKLFLGSLLVVLSVLLTTGGSFLRGYQADRLNFKDPCERYQEETGYQLCNSFIAFKNGGLTGQGIGESTQKYLYLPESYTDFIFLFIFEECGLIVGIIILLIFLIILFRILKVAKKADNLHNSLISYGVFAYMALHIIVNLGGVMGCLPLTGVPLPYLSYGGSYTISFMIALGLVERVAIETSIKKEKTMKNGV